MVRTRPTKRKNENAQDFKRVKSKVGRRAAPSNTHVDTSFKSRTIHVREQSVVADKAGVIVSSRNLTLPELLSKAKHHNAGVRKDALDGVLEIVEAFGGRTEVSAQLPTVVTTMVESINDEDKQVRLSVHALLEALLNARPARASEDETDVEEDAGQAVSDGRVHWCSPFFRLIMFHVCAGLSSLQLGRRLDALDLVDLLAASFPGRVRDFERKLLPLYTSLSSSALAQVGGGSAAKPGGSGSSSARAGGAPGNAGPAETAMPSISRRTTGILTSFKNANGKKSASRPKATATGQDRPKKGAAARADDTWARVAKAFLRLLRLLFGDADALAPVRDGLDGHPSSSISGGGGGSSISAALGQAQVHAPRFRSLCAPTQQGRAAADEELEHPEAPPAAPAIKAGSAAAAASPLAGTRQGDFALALEAAQGLLTQSYTILADFMGGRGDELARDQACENVRVAAELVVLLQREVLTQANATATAVADRSLARFVEAFPITTRGASGGALAAAQGAGASGAASRRRKDAESLSPASSSSLMNANLLLAASILDIAQNEAVATTLKAKAFDEACEAVARWLSSELVRHEPSASSESDNAALERLLGVVERAACTAAIPSGVREKLNKRFADCLDEWFTVASVLREPAQARAAASLLRCVVRFLAVQGMEDPSGSTDEESGDEGPRSLAPRSATANAQARKLRAAWVVALPRMAWQAAQFGDTTEVAVNALALLRYCAIRGVAVAEMTREDWTQVTRWLTPLLFTQSKSTKEHIVGPFLGQLHLAAKLQVLDLIVVLPVRLLPAPLLRALAYCVDAVARGTVPVSEDCERPRGRALLLSRMVQVPFARLSAAVAHGRVSQDERVEVLANLISFSVTVVWGPAMDPHIASGEGTGTDPREGEEEQLDAEAAGHHAFAVIDQVCSHLRALQQEEGVPVAQLIFPLVHQLAGQLASTEEAPSQSAELHIDFARAMAMHGRGRSSMQDRLLRLSRLVLGIHQAPDKGFDSFPDSFIRFVAFGCMGVQGSFPSDGAGAHAGRCEEMLSELVALVPATELAAPLLDVLRFEGGLDTESKVRFSRGWARALRLQNSAPQLAGSAPCKGVLEYMRGCEAQVPAFKDVLGDVALAQRAA